jgi:NADPH:quinone reductase-like Zn-dependent oxidoreductase
MKAATYHRYGPADVLTVTDVPIPAPNPGEILVEVHASSVTTADWRLRASAFPGGLWLPGRLTTGLFRPRRPILGTEFSGRIAQVGDGVSAFREGDAVFGFSGHGGNAEYLVMPADGPIAPLPAGLSHAEAAALPFGAISALVFLRDVARVRPGQSVLVIGASGGVGVYAVQIARHMGARVTGVASGDNRDLVLGLGAEAFVDYRAEEPTAPAAGFDVILDTVGAMDFKAARPLLAREGVFVPLNFGVRDAVRVLVSSWRNGPKMKIAVSGDSRADLDALSGLVATGALRPVIDRTFPLDDIAAAHAHVEGRHRKGSVIVAVRPAPKVGPARSGTREAAGQPVPRVA